MKTLPFWAACMVAFAVPFFGALAKGMANPASDRLVTIIEATYFGFLGLSGIGVNKIMKGSIERKARETKANDRTD